MAGEPQYPVRYVGRVVRAATVAALGPLGVAQGVAAVAPSDQGGPFLRFRRVGDRWLRGAPGGSLFRGCRWVADSMIRHLSTTPTSTPPLASTPHTCPHLHPHPHLHLHPHLHPHPPPPAPTPRPRPFPPRPPPRTHPSARSRQGRRRRRPDGMLGGRVTEMAAAGVRDGRTPGAAAVLSGLAPFVAFTLGHGSSPAPPPRRRRSRRGRRRRRPGAAALPRASPHRRGACRGRRGRRGGRWRGQRRRSRS